MSAQQQTPERPGTPRWIYLVVVIQFLVILALGLHSFHLRLSPVAMSYADWISILLTALGLIISVLAVFLAVLAFVGWQTFDRRVRQRVQEILGDGEVLVLCLAKEWGINGRLRKHLQDAVERVSYDMGGEKVDSSGEGSN